MNILRIRPPNRKHYQISNGQSQQCIRKTARIMERNYNSNVKQLIKRIVNWITRIHKHWKNSHLRIEPIKYDHCQKTKDYHQSNSAKETILSKICQIGRNIIQHILVSSSKQTQKHAPKCNQEKDTLKQKFINLMNVLVIWMNILHRKLSIVLILFLRLIFLKLEHNPLQAQHQQNNYC